ncbi:CRACD-like protein isoform X2 [Alosa alosa]|uniref:CRACD-like protein isoform X2 n=1 Tax=Alosa alosa TaxID=278164 RepID=UPI0020151302|nr:CRACD-like protein isoform X2 [Alosa alosa]
MYRSTEVERGGEDVPGRKKSRFKALKSRLFGRLRRKDTDGVIKPSQSASDIMAPEAARGGYDSEEDSLCPRGTLSSRALSHDSIFLADQAQSSSESTRVLSQENVHSKIKALQMKLQQQNFHLGPPPLLIPSKRQEDSGATSDDDGLPHSPPEISFQDGGRHTSSYKRNHSSLSLAGTGSEEEEQTSSRPLSPLSRPSLRASSPTRTAASSPPPDFSSPAQFTSSLDTSAARHKMAVKPRNQRPSNKAKKMSSSVLRPRSESMHDLVQVLSEGEEDGLDGAGPSEERSRFRSHSTQIGVSDRERFTFLELRADREYSLSPLPQEEHSPTPDPEDRIPRASYALVLSEDEDPEQTDPEVRVTPNPLYLQPMPEDLQAEPSDFTPAPELESTLPETTKTEPATTERSRDEEHEEEEDAEDLTEAHKQLDTTEGNLLPNVTPSRLDLEIPKLYEQSVDDHEQCVDDLEQSVDDLEQSVDDLEQSVDDPAGEYRPTQEAESVPSGEKRKSLVSDVSLQAVSQADTLTKYQPVAAPRVSKPTSDLSYTVPLRRGAESSAESDKEISAHPEVVLRARVTPAGQESQMLLDNEKRRPNSGSFSISSARRRSRVVDSGEWITNPEEVRKPVEPASRAPLNNKDIPEKRREQLEQKTKEAAQRHQLAPEKRGSLRREIVPDGAVTRAAEEKMDERSRDAKRRTETMEEKRNAFGVTLRTTSLSLKYRSETAQSEAKYKRHSLEASNKRAISEDLPGQHTGNLQSSRDTASSTMRAEAPKKSFGLRKNPSMSSDSGPTATSAEDLKSKDSASTTRPWDRGSTEGLTTGAALQKTASTPTPPKLPAKPSTLPPAPKPTPRVATDRPLSSWGTDRTAADRRCDWANMGDKKATVSKMSDRAACGDSQTKYISKPAGCSDSSGSQASSSPSLQQSARGQPSWMELAKRKSLAWNDKTDSRHNYE